MLNTYTTINQILTAPIKQSLAAARSIFKTEDLVDLLVENQIQELSKIRKKHPELPRVVAIRIALLNSAVKLQNNKHSEKYCLAKVKKAKANPQQEWLTIHKSFVIDLANKQASLREIEKAIFYRFHHKISHSKIAEFLKVEGEKHVL